MRLLALAALLAASACSSGPRALPDDVPDDVPGGLSADDRDRLEALGVPVVVPGETGAFDLVGVEVNAPGGAVGYALDYRRADGACFEVSGGDDGFGGPAPPLVSTAVEVPGLGRTVRVYQAADDPGATSAQVWGLGTVVSGFIDLDGAAALFLSDTQGGCRPVSLDDGARIVAGLRLLSGAAFASGGATAGGPASGDLGPFAPADDVVGGSFMAASPEAAAQAIASLYADEADRVTVDVLSQASYEAVALVTLLGLRDDSVRDERLRLTLTPVGREWRLAGAGRQVRCQPGRGHQDWSDGRCL